MADMRLIVAGAGGRMGRTLVKAIAETKGLVLAGAVEGAGLAADRPGCRRAGRAGSQRHQASAPTPAPLLANADGIIDFTVPAASTAFAALPRARCISSAPPGFRLTRTSKRSRSRARSAVVVKSGNISLGVNLLAALTKRVAKTLDDSFDIEIVEMHHNKKIDAPSGTALMFGRAAAEGRGIDLAAHSARGRDGETGARKAGDIGFASLRGGTVVGEHSVIFAGPAERIELVHRAEDRMIFARGALHAALWARGQKPGLYSMADVLGLKDF